MKMLVTLASGLASSVLALSLVPSLAVAGMPGNSELSCRSAGFQISGILNDVSSDFDLKTSVTNMFDKHFFSQLRQDSSGVTDENANLQVYSALEHRIFTLTLSALTNGSVDNPHVSLRLHGLPDTFRTVSKGRDTQVTFTGIANYFMYPNKSAVSESRSPRVSCTLTQFGI